MLKRKLVGVIIISFLLTMGYVAYAYENDVYIWQRSWDEFVRQGISDIDSVVNKFIVLVGDYKYQDGISTINTVNVNWKYFKKNTGVILAFRINTPTKHLLETSKGIRVAQSIGDALNEIIDKATIAGVGIDGVQFDYDCPTSRLNDYALFLEEVKKVLPGHNISITALPTWLSSGSFKDLIKGTSYYVLQLHSFEIPKTADDAKQIFLKDMALSYCSKASQLRHPFYVSLPTYGYEVVFDNKGSFVGLRAEVDPSVTGDGYEYQVVTTSPEDILHFLRNLDAGNRLLGICWFRMPLKTDEFNWHPKTFKQVLSDQLPRIDFKTYISASEKGLYEVYLVNSGDSNISGSVSFDINWAQAEAPFYDVVGRYGVSKKQDGNGIQVTGFPPKVGNKELVAWFRFTDANIDKNPLLLSEVTVNGTNL